VLVIEGLIYAFIPRYARRLVEMMAQLNNDQLRMAGAGSLAAGVLVIWLAQIFLR
jgi:uncharacterized protein YjeT (DUF2065 family)